MSKGIQYKSKQHAAIVQWIICELEFNKVH